MKEDGVVDLNMVFDDLDDDGDYEVLEGVASGEGEGETVTPGEDDGLASKDGEGGVAKLVTVKDDIPDDEFEAMLSSSKSLASLRRGSTGKKSTSLDDPVPSSHGLVTPSCDPVTPSRDPVAPSLGPVALILVPTRELAMQIHSHLTEVAKYTNIKVRVCVVVGGGGGGLVYPPCDVRLNVVQESIQDFF